MTTERRTFTIRELYDLPAAVDLMTAARVLHMGANHPPTSSPKMVSSPVGCSATAGPTGWPPRSFWSYWASPYPKEEYRLESSRHSDSICCHFTLRPVPLSTGRRHVLAGNAMGFHGQMTVKRGRALLSA